MEIFGFGIVGSFEMPFEVEVLGESGGNPVGFETLASVGGKLDGFLKVHDLIFMNLPNEKKYNH